MTARRGDRLAGVALIGLAAGAALEARGFTSGFLTDPLGPRAFPWFAAALLAAGAGILIARPEPGPGPAWPDAVTWRRTGIAVATVLLYGAVLRTLGFVIATTGAMAGLSLLFGGRLGWSLVAGAGFSLALYLLFVYGLGLFLPAGVLVGG